MLTVFVFFKYIYQTFLNGSRIGFYEPLRRTFNSTFGYEVGQQIAWCNILSGSLSGMAGAFAGSPFYLVKTRMQTFSPAVQIGDQTHYRNFWHGLSSIYRAEGIKGMYRGVDAAMIRTGMGSSVQLPLYEWAKRTIQKYDLISPGPQLHLISSAISGLGVCCVMNPADVLMTRMYNQKGSMYKSPLDCFVKLVKLEGPLALYKGFGPHLMRIGPHTVFTLTFMEQSMGLIKRIEGVPF